VPIGRGFLYLVAVMDWASRAVLSWRLSNTMDVSFCVSALEEALVRFGKNLQHRPVALAQVRGHLSLDNAGALPTCPQPPQQQEGLHA
jgi:transposase InsO family protein